MAYRRTFLDKVLLFIKGLAMGAANKVPGVSGGIIAFVVGFYEELIYSLQKINGKALKLIINRRYKSFYYYINAPFLIFIFGGSMFSYFTISRVLDFFLKNYELYVWSSFFGLIIGSVYYISIDFKNWNLKNAIALIIGIAIGLSISFMSPAKENNNLWFVFFCGMIGVSGMTLPGLSGSFIIMLLGNYVLLLVDSVNQLSYTLSDIAAFNFGFIHDPTRMLYLKIIAAFTAGSVFGLVITSHILGFVLKRWHEKVTALIIGFISGSLATVWPWKREIFRMQNGKTLIDANGNKVLENYERFIPDFGNPHTWIAMFFIILGILILIFLKKVETKNNQATYE